jgi:hypothetical protein
MTLVPGLCFPLLYWWTFVTVTTITGAIEVGGKDRTMTGMAKTPSESQRPLSLITREGVFHALKMTAFSSHLVSPLTPSVPPMNEYP